ncbi:hypothetical protein ACFSQT_28715 [Mesorhizobium calcicola]|uniref:Uncharacterized protein n=1 Tax=Mesorhizobium calcicola TaxID=1300310 RepID=A0ABW4WKI1_9HYPH
MTNPSPENMPDAEVGAKEVGPEAVAPETVGPKVIGEVPPSVPTKTQAAPLGAHAPSLRDLYDAHSGKVSDKWSTYLDAYDRIFLDYRNRPVRLLEIGVQNGGSLEIWPRYFPNSELILGCDIDVACSGLIFDDKKIAMVIGDANTDEVEQRIVEKSATFDIIIDDGSHKSSDIVRSFARYFPHLSDGGVYIAEDLHSSYWRELEGGLYDPLSSMSFFKRLLDVLNHEHWGLPRVRADVLATFADRYETEFGEDSLASVHSVEFLNSLCIITKRPNRENVLGARNVQGGVALADRRMVRLDGTTSEAIDQAGNPWSLTSTTMEAEIETSRALVTRSAMRIEELSREIAETREQLRSGHDEIARMRAHLVERAEEIRVLQEEISAAHAAAGALMAERDSARTLQAERDDEIARAQVVMAALQEKLKQSEFAVQELRGSTSWRITSPLRALSVSVRWLLKMVASVFR